MASFLEAVGSKDEYKPQASGTDKLIHGIMDCVSCFPCQNFDLLMFTLAVHQQYISHVLQ